jgi:hypothetical protein
MTNNIAQPPTIATKFQTLAALEPSLNELLAEARSHKCGCANAIMFGGLRSSIRHTVGWTRGCGPAELQTQEAYDVTFRTLYDALPDCSGCGCLTREQVLY